MSLTIGANPTLTITFGTGSGQVSTIAELNAALSGLVGGTAQADPLTGDTTVTASSSSDNIVVGGDANPRSFGIQTQIALPSNGTVIANDATTFINESIAGGAITAYDTSGATVNMQLRWAKTDSALLGTGHTDTWNLFYQTNSQRLWHPAGLAATSGVNYTFGSNGQLNPPITAVTLSMSW